MLTTVSKEVKRESLELLRQYEQSPSTEVRNELVQLNFGLVRKEVHHWMQQCPENYDDLLQVGCLGLIRAIERFDLSKGHAFSSFAVPYIRGEIQHYLRDKSPSVRIPRNWLTLQRQAAKVVQKLQVELNRHPSDAEIAEGLGIPLNEWHEIKLACRNRAPLSLDAPVVDEEEGAASLGELVPDPGYRSFQLAQEDRIRLQQALANLEERTRHVLEFVFLYDLTQKETAERLGISAVTVSRRVKKGLDALKQMMGTNL
ncbi:RNA polymerase sigma factor SigF [Oxynema sp. CENA135]|jgi:RNA polymerase sigma-B factor|uniref:RNA polymerase sigma factor SigF n=1 Tax=Oxynema aestuarii AP17 TaxID=2064643 RepID=A0A6H1U1L0_9CYAN|nr:MULTISPECIES: RNA polymerase sigma factor SigF [Oxynema]MBK4731566.1 RNA polymerase sigma factor SigF [Oxynema sp. CENA135]QIZ72724.1 RNA polymerase sigma factor SigF [Oxynema aestuarii AP17]RMH75771.1 MAG: RNA polymerase sigma factor SigF [Cyanobacteria bacterium J007]